MEGAMFSFEEYNFGGTQDELSSTSNKSSNSVNGANIRKRSYIYGVDEWGESEGIVYGFSQLDSMEEGLLLSKSQQQEQKETAQIVEIPSGIQDVQESKRKNQRQAFSLASLNLLKKYDYGRLNGGRIVDPNKDVAYANLAGSEISTEKIIRIAGARFIQSCCQMVDIASMLNNPFGLSFPDLSGEEAKTVELVEFLLASAEKVSNQQFERASRLLNYCDILSSNTGNPVQRVVYYFSEALRERIDIGTGTMSSKGFVKKQYSDLDQEIKTFNAVALECLQRIPFFQVARFTAIQVIVENVASAKRIHIIDLEIRNGVQWSVLMQALASQHNCPLELLTITAIGTSSKQLIENTGKRLASFAESMSIPFSFKAFMVSDMLELKEDMFELDAEEAVAIYSEFFFMSLIFVPDRLDSIMRVLSNINPRTMVVMEVEANNNSSSFENRFIEALFFYSAYFDCFDACMERDNPNRMNTELIFFDQGIRNIVAHEGEERRIRHVKIDVWRSFFARFGIRETELSTSSLYQASLVLEKFDSGSCCTLDMDKKSLLIGWKGTPIQSLSVWRFT